MARGNVKTFILAGVLTILLFMSIYSLNLFFNSRRETRVDHDMDELLEELEDIEASSYLIDYLTSNNGSCDAVIEQLNYLESRLWKLDQRINRYRDAQEEFTGEEFYMREKRRLNRREIIQLSIINKVREMCDYKQTIILYFYGNCKTVPNCGEQGYVLSYINELIDPEIVIFSFDGDQETQVVGSLMKAYNVTGYPCVVVEDGTYCGLRDRDELMTLLCSHSPNLSIC